MIVDANTARSRLVFDITDLLDFVKHNDSVSGIQRFIVAVLNAVQPNDGAHMVFWRNGAIHTIKPIKGASCLAALVSYIEIQRRRSAFARTPLLAPRKIDRAYRAFLARDCRLYSKRRFSFRSSDNFIILGAVWCYDNYLEYLENLKIRAGFSVSAFVHDMIPYICEDLVSYDAFKKFTWYARWLERNADALLTNSDHSQRSLGEFSLVLKTKPISVVKLAHEFAPLSIRPSHKRFVNRIGEDVFEAARTPFVLCVGTLEPRKNQFTLLKCWSRLHSRGVQLPRLVLAGRWGWNCDSISIAVAKAPGDMVSVLSNVNDAGLALLYSKCRFTAFLSLYEGWGIPVGESLSFGKLCVASQTTSVPEVGGHHCIYCDPTDMDSVEVAIQEAMQRTEGGCEFTFSGLRSWNNVARELLDAISDRTSRGARCPHDVSPPPGAWLEVNGERGRSSRLGGDSVVDDGAQKQRVPLMRRKLLRYLADKYDYELLKRQPVTPLASASALPPDVADPATAAFKRLLDIMNCPPDARQSSEYRTIPALTRRLFFRSSICTAADFRDPEFARWRGDLGELPVMHRKIWERVFIAAHLEAAGMLQPGRRGIVFGVGFEPSPAAFAARGAEILATDMAADAAAAAGWVATGEHASRVEALNDRELCPPREFAERVSFEVCDMNAISSGFNEFDFCWSSCSLEHLGSIRRGIEFVRNAMKTLRPGGIAVHTTEYNISSNEDTIDNNPSTVVFRRRDIEMMVEELRQDNCAVSDVCFDVLTEPIDFHVDTPPFKHNPHLRLELGGYVCSSIGIVAQRL